MALVGPMLGLSNQFATKNAHIILFFGRSCYFMFKAEIVYYTKLKCRISVPLLDSQLFRYDNTKKRI
jgi:hypothetical protein